jgi:hypothetical protein
MRASSLVFIAAVVASSTSNAAAQECVGIPSRDKVYFAAGMAGTDGASGDALLFDYQFPRASVLLEQRSLGVFAHANPQSISSAQVSVKVKGLHGCVVSGANWQAWNTEGSESRSWSSSDPNVFVERHSVGGYYTRLRIPLGVSFGRTLEWKAVSVTPFVNPFAVFESESYRSNEPALSGAKNIRGSFGEGLATGLGLRLGWFMMRPTLMTTHTRDRALSGKQNEPEFAMHLGVVF